MSKDKNRKISCFCQSLQATESVHWIQWDQLCHGLVGCLMFFVVLLCWLNWALMKFKAVIRQELCSSVQIQSSSVSVATVENCVSVACRAMFIQLAVEINMPKSESLNQSVNFITCPLWIGTSGLLYLDYSFSLYGTCCMMPLQSSLYVLHFLYCKYLIRQRTKNTPVDSNLFSRWK